MTILQDLCKLVNFTVPTLPEDWQMQSDQPENAVTLIIDSIKIHISGA